MGERQQETAGQAKTIEIEREINHRVSRFLGE